MGTYTLVEIKRIIDEATQIEMWENKQEEWKKILNMQTRLYDLFGIDEE